MSCLHFPFFVVQWLGLDKELKRLVIETTANQVNGPCIVLNSLIVELPIEYLKLIFSQLIRISPLWCYSEIYNNQQKRERKRYTITSVLCCLKFMNCTDNCPVLSFMISCSIVKDDNYMFLELCSEGVNLLLAM